MGVLAPPPNSLIPNFGQTILDSLWLLWTAYKNLRIYQCPNKRHHCRLPTATHYPQMWPWPSTVSIAQCCYVDTMLRWVTSFVSGITQQVTYDGQLSLTTPVAFGVPQGPVFIWVMCDPSRAQWLLAQLRHINMRMLKMTMLQEGEACSVFT